MVIYSKVYPEKEDVIIERLRKRTESKKRELRGGAGKGIGGCSGKGKGKGMESSGRDYSEADVSVYMRQKNELEEPDINFLKDEKAADLLIKEAADFNSSSFAAVSLITVDASMELRERFNCVMEKLLQRI